MRAGEVDMQKDRLAYVPEELIKKTGTSWVANIIGRAQLQKHIMERDADRLDIFRRPGTGELPKGPGR
jgi:hypothetical protein